MTDSLNSYGTSSHTCPPIWYCRDEDCPDEDAQKIYATDAEKAACIFAQSDDHHGGDYLTLRDVFVSDSDHNNEQTFEVRLEMEPTYRAELITTL